MSEAGTEAVGKARQTRVAGIYDVAVKGIRTGWPGEPRRTAECRGRYVLSAPEAVKSRLGMQLNVSWARSGRAVAVALSIAGAGATAQAPADLDALMAHVGERVQQYYRRAQSIVCDETVTLQELGMTFSSEGFPRVLEYELRVAWEATQDDLPQQATVTRKILKINGRAPKPGAEPGCMDPKSVSPEPLAFLTPHERGRYLFAWSSARSHDPQTLMVDFRSREARKPEITWRGDCVSFDLPGRTRGRLWIDRESNDVVRMDESLIGQFDYRVPHEKVRPNVNDLWVIERADLSIRYKPVLFRDPEETVLLPDSIEWLQVIRGAGIPRVRMSQKFSRYRRFLTDARIVKKP